MNASNSLAAAARTIEPYPRYLQTHKDNSESLLDAQHRPIWWRATRNTRPKRVAETSRLPRASAIIDLWSNGVSPRHCPAAAWEVREVMRRWRLWEGE